MFLVPIAIELPIVLLAHVRHTGFAIGAAVGMGAAAAVVLFDSPPARIENWRTGSEGEKSTARQLRPLLRRGWTLFNDIDTGHGNIDHVLVGPAGVFMLESKRLAGQVRVVSGKLVVRWHEDPEDGYENETIASRARGAAADLHRRIDLAGTRPWVQATVVLWADFEQGSIKRDNVAWIHGNDLRAVLEARPVEYSGESLERVTASTRAAVKSFRDGPRPPVDGAMD
jgi:hypothetical protein